DGGDEVEGAIHLDPAPQTGQGFLGASGKRGVDLGEDLRDAVTGDEVVAPAVLERRGIRRLPLLYRLQGAGEPGGVELSDGSPDRTRGHEGRSEDPGLAALGPGEMELGETVGRRLESGEFHLPELPFPTPGDESFAPARELGRDALGQLGLPLRARAH